MSDNKRACLVCCWHTHKGSPWMSMPSEECCECHAVRSLHGEEMAPMIYVPQSKERGLRYGG